jgi:hypothetical protein
MPKADSRRKSVSDVAGQARTRASTASLFVKTPGWLRPADQLDYKIRRWVIPVHNEGGWSIAPTVLQRSLLRKHSPGVSRFPHRESTIGSSGS